MIDVLFGLIECFYKLFINRNITLYHIPIYYINHQLKSYIVVKLKKKEKKYRDAVSVFARIVLFCFLLKCTDSESALHLPSLALL